MASRSKIEQEKQAEKNRQQLLKAESGALSLLLLARKDIGKGDIFERRAASAIMAGRSSARRIAQSSILSDLAAVAITPGGADLLVDVIAIDAARAISAARALAQRATKLATGGASAADVRAAIKPSLARTAATESAHAFGTERVGVARSARDSVVRILKVWDAQLDKRTCPTCAGLDGLIVGIGEAFPVSQPAHPNCRCTFTILRADEAGGSTTIRALGRT